MKRKGKTPRFKTQRRLLMELPGMGKAGAMERKPYPPGQHGQRRRKYSEFGLQLEEKQKIRFHYGVREEQFRRLIKKAQKSSNSNWVEALVNLLEKRLDNVVFRLGFAVSVPAAKQMVSHGKVLVNGKKVNIGSQIIKVGDVITLKPDAYENQTYLQAKQSPRLPLPSFMMKEEKGGVESGRLIDEPNIEAVPFAFDAGLVISYYSLRG
ncbi:30S ribosomal protein S4 [Bdellovibrio svalbardensis]|uniref:Small ribosomal subunit protein uS4 n=1 Tax=Bdellovibrio svalbardensis TaxID=2972972 RepID=A0ABT6DH75_9BACT|nr:30S ribosomal protein S4 [Bdellovibrio svalbardensis]MDG0815615.1 30S ribosomal protein S4 [Bdellovibrio svalbardensis]